MVNKNKTSNKKRFWILTLVVALALVVGGSYALFHKPRHATSGVIVSTSPQTSQSNQASSGQKSQAASPTQTAPQKSDGASATTTPSTVSLISPPTGTFVSNHHPSLDGSPRPSAEQSTCNTAPGATCYIKFTQGSIVKTLPAKTADSDGSVIWNWDVNTAGFTTGTWQITAVASSGSQTFSTTDSMPLEVE